MATDQYRLQPARPSHSFTTPVIPTAPSSPQAGPSLRAQQHDKRAPVLPPWVLILGWITLSTAVILQSASLPPPRGGAPPAAAASCLSHRADRAAKPSRCPRNRPHHPRRARLQPPDHAHEPPPPLPDARDPRPAPLDHLDLGARPARRVRRRAHERAGRRAARGGAGRARGRRQVEGQERRDGLGHLAPPDVRRRLSLSCASSSPASTTTLKRRWPRGRGPTLTCPLVAARSLPIAVLFSLSLVLSNVAYLYCSVAFIHILKSFAPVAILLAAFAFRTKSFSLRLLGIVITISLGGASLSLRLGVSSSSDRRANDIAEAHR